MYTFNYVLWLVNCKEWVWTVNYRNIYSVVICYTRYVKHWWLNNLISVDVGHFYFLCHMLTKIEDSSQSSIEYWVSMISQDSGALRLSRCLYSLFILYIFLFLRRSLQPARGENMGVNRWRVSLIPPPFRKLRLGWRRISGN